jgi:uncharacterized DUF497 family protein
MEVEFNPEKDRINREKHGVGLDSGGLILMGPSVQWTSSHSGHGEIRRVAVGLLEGIEFTCVFTMRGEVARIVSVRRSRHEERDRFWKVWRPRTSSDDDDA